MNNDVDDSDTDHSVHTKSAPDRRSRSRTDKLSSHLDDSDTDHSVHTKSGPERRARSRTDKLSSHLDDSDTDHSTHATKVLPDRRTRFKSAARRLDNHVEDSDTDHSSHSKLRHDTRHSVKSENHLNDSDTDRGQAKVSIDRRSRGRGEKKVMNDVVDSDTDHTVATSHKRKTPVKAESKVNGCDSSNDGTDKTPQKKSEKMHKKLNSGVNGSINHGIRRHYKRKSFGRHRKINSVHKKSQDCDMSSSNSPLWGMTEKRATPITNYDETSSRCPLPGCDSKGSFPHF